jgi:hypothetical protein
MRGQDPDEIQSCARNRDVGQQSPEGNIHLRARC